MLRENIETVYSKNLTAEELVSLGEIETSSDPFVQDVHALSISKTNLESELSLLSQGNIKELTDPRLKKLVRTLSIILNPERPATHSFLSSSVHHKREFEVLYTAIVVNSYRERGFHPLVVPIDAFYTFEPRKTAGIVSKIKSLSEVGYNKSRKDNKPHVIILSDFCDSIVFDENTLNSVPAQDNRASSSNWKKLHSGKTHELLANGGLPNFLSTLSSLHPDKKEAIKLVTCTALLSQDPETWQKLWYENKKEGGLPLFIVAPQSFHLAMNRLNFCHGHGSQDYYVRANDVRYFTPLFDVNDNGVFQESLDQEHDWFNAGASKEVFSDALTVLDGI